MFQMKIFKAQTLTSTQLVFLVSYTLGMLIQIFTPSHAGTNVVEKCDLIPVATFSSEWYELEQNEKKSLLIFIIRSVRPFVMFAGILFQMNITTFIKVKIWRKIIYTLCSNDFKSKWYTFLHAILITECITFD